VGEQAQGQTGAVPVEEPSTASKADACLCRDPRSPLAAGSAVFDICYSSGPLLALVLTVASATARSAATRGAALMCGADGAAFARRCSRRNHQARHSIDDFRY
jgi:hypothetical protein